MKELILLMKVQKRIYNSKSTQAPEWARRYSVDQQLRALSKNDI
jgi:hypothetical protein